MNKTTKSYQPYILAFVFFLVIPNAFFAVSSYKMNELYYEQSKELLGVCYDQAKNDVAFTQNCSRIYSAVNQSFSSATAFFTPVLSILTALILGLSIGIINLKRQLDELKEKLNV